MPAAASARYRRTAWLDYVDLHDPDGLAVLTTDSGGNGTVRVLAGIAPELWRAADGRDLAELVDAATERYGAPEGVDGAAAVLQAIGALMDAGLVASDEPVLARGDEVAWTERGDEVYALALDESEPRPRLLAGTAAVIWDWLGEPITLTQLQARALEDVGRAGPAIAAEVAAFVESLGAAGLVCRVDAEPSELSEPSEPSEP